MPVTKKPFKYPGSKRYLAEWILSLFPPRGDYDTLTEPYCGSAAVLFRHDPAGKAEVLNDLDGRLTNFFHVLQDPAKFECFRRRVEATPFSEPEFDDALARLPGAYDDDVDRAYDFFVVVRQSRGGDMESFAPPSTSRLRRGMNEQVSAWLSAVANLPAVHQRLLRVMVYNRDALDVIRQFDHPRTVQYLDPPYLPETRVTADVYHHEMTVAQHEEMLDAVRQCKSKVLISGYASPLYEGRLHDWDRHEREIDNKASHQKVKPKKVEVVWRNF